MADLARIRTPGGAAFTVAQPHAERFQGFLNDLEGAGYKINGEQSGGYNYRTIAGTNKLSNHAHGAAIDVNWTDNARGTPGSIPADLARSLAQKHGLTWGGDWKNPDPMHFEVAGLTPQQAPSGFGGPASPQQSQQQAQPMPSLSYQSTPEPSGNFFDRLGDTMQSPLFMMGAGVMSGPTIGAGIISGAEAAQKGAQAKLIQQELMRKRAQEQNRDGMWQGLFQSGDIDNVLKGYPGITKQALFAMGPDQGSQLIGKLASGKGDQQFQLDMLEKQMELKRKAELALQQDKLRAVGQAFGVPSMGGGQEMPAQPQAQPSAPPATPRIGGFSAPAMGMVPPTQQPQAPSPASIDPMKLMALEAAGIIPSGAGKVLTENPAYQMQQRAAAVQQYGYDMKDPSTQALIMNGKMPELIPDRHAIMEADKSVRSGKKVASSLDLAEGYHKDAYAGAGANMRATIMNNIPFVGGTKESKATVDMDTEILTSMLPQLKAAFPTRITNQDIKLFESIQPSSGMTFDQRAKAISRAKERTQELIQEAQMEADQLRGGSFYKMGGGVSGAQKPAPAQSSGGWGIQKE